jgi:hypothetical protein
MHPRYSAHVVGRPEPQGLTHMGQCLQPTQTHPPPHPRTRPAIHTQTHTHIHAPTHSHTHTQTPSVSGSVCANGHRGDRPRVGAPMLIAICPTDTYTPMRDLCVCLTNALHIVCLSVCVSE